MVQGLSFGYDGGGGLGDRLLAAVLRGEKTATSSLAVEYLSGERLPRVGERLHLMDHAGQVRGVVETTRVTITPLHLVDDQVARDEGEGFADAADWRQAHAAFWAEVLTWCGATHAMGRHFITVQEAKANYGERWSVVARQFLDADAVRHPHHCLTECDDDGTGLTHPYRHRDTGQHHQALNPRQPVPGVADPPATDRLTTLRMRLRSRWQSRRRGCAGRCATTAGPGLPRPC